VFKLMTWNLENLFRPGTPYGAPDDAVYADKLSGLAREINAQQPDALAVQEVGHAEALQDLVDRLDGQWHITLSSYPDQRQIRVGWLTRAPVGPVAEPVDFLAPLRSVQIDDGVEDATRMSRGALATEVTTDAGNRLRLVTAHLKSKLLTFPGGRFQPRDEDERARFAAYALYRRSAEAETLRVWVTSALADHGELTPLILAGDLNDTPQAATTQLLFGPPGSQIGSGGFNHPDKGDHQRLWDLSPKMPAGSDYSRIFEGHRELIDQILVSAALVRKVQSVGAVTSSQPLPSITVDPHARRAQPSSDHAPVVASFDI
jgi:endonuclease/exonuclease/phosphatase family metal-dependent hydrolase